MNDFGHNLRKIREMRGLSLEQMAEKIGKSERTYSKIESGERDMTRNEMKEVAKLLEIPEEVMMSLDKRPIFNSFNNNQDGEYFNTYSGEAAGKTIDLIQRTTKLESRVEFLEKMLLKLVGEKQDV